MTAVSDPGPSEPDNSVPGEPAEPAEPASATADHHREAAQRPSANHDAGHREPADHGTVEPGASLGADTVPALISRGQGGVALSVAAREIFAERGYHGASIRDIAKRAGLSLSALYYWHNSKQDLFAALLEDSVSDYFRTCDAALRASGEDPADRLAAVVRATVDYRVRRRVESAIATRDLRNLEPASAGRLVRLRESASQLFQDIIDEGVRAGAFHCGHPTDSRRAIQAACNAIAQWYDPDGDLGPEEIADRYVAIALRIVGATPKP